MNILLPLAGKNYYKDNEIISLIQINRKIVLEYILDNLNFSKKDRFIFIVNQKDCDIYYIDSILKLLEPNNITIKVKNITQGQLCSCLLAIGYINNHEPLLIVNGDQYIFEDISKIVDYFNKYKADGGIVTFNSIHPKWSFALLDKDERRVIETSEKNPISNVACTGLFYYKNGKDFVEAGKSVIKKRTIINGKYYVSSTYNEMILMNKKVIAYKIKNENFFELDSDETINNFRLRLKNKN